MGVETKQEVPASMAEDVAKYRAQLVEAAAEGDDELTMKYLEEETLTEEEITTGALPKDSGMTRSSRSSQEAPFRGRESRSSSTC
jgi:hypothetical protein